MKRCPKCGADKPLSDYSIYKTGRRAGRPHSHCRACNSAESLQWHRNNPERAKQRAARSNRLRALRQRELTEAEYNAMFAEQNGVCAICSQPSDIALSIDHDHATGKVRGLLCKACNVGPGSFRDVPERLEQAAAYLRRAA